MSEYTPARNPKMFRGGKMTAAAFTREYRKLSWAWDGAAFCGNQSEMDRISAQQSTLYRAFKEGR